MGKNDIAIIFSHFGDETVLILGFTAPIKCLNCYTGTWTILGVPHLYSYIIRDNDLDHSPSGAASKISLMNLWTYIQGVNSYKYILAANTACPLNFMINCCHFQIFEKKVKFKGHNCIHSWLVNVLDVAKFPLLK